eukprot:1329816-Amorphochlora_amoeboformis.AAC.2
MRLSDATLFGFPPSSAGDTGERSRPLSFGRCIHGCTDSRGRRGVKALDRLGPRFPESPPRAEKSEQFGNNSSASQQTEGIIRLKERFNRNGRRRRFDSGYTWA